MIGLDAVDLLGGQLVAPGAGFAAAEEVATAKGTRRLAKALVLLLLPQLREIGKGDGAPQRAVVRRPASEVQDAAQRAERISLQILVTDEMHGKIALVEPGRDMAAPAGKFLPQLIVQPVRLGAKAGLAIAHECKSLIDANSAVIGERGSDTARIAHDPPRAVRAARARQ